jgi:hypothetical protein
MKLRQFLISDLKYLREDPNEMTAEEFRTLKDFLADVGMVDPIVVNQDGLVIGGKHRCRAWTELGNKKIPGVEVYVQPGKEQKVALGLNKIKGHWNEPKLLSALQRIATEDPSAVTLTGFKMGEVQRLSVRSFGVGRLTEVTDEVRDFKKVHVLFSMSPKIYQAVQELLKQIGDKEGVEVEQGAN